MAVAVESSSKSAVDLVALQDALTVTAGASSRLFDRWDELSEGERRLLAEMISRRSRELEVVLLPVLRKVSAAL